MEQGTSGNWTYRFQSTPPARGATAAVLVRVSGPLISIHAPREGGDLVDLMATTLSDDFNPRPPRGGRRRRDDPPHQHDVISIHAPREGGDRVQRDLQHDRPISIHAPREGGDGSGEHGADGSQQFQSTPPARGATKIIDTSNIRLKFQSTPPARGATCVSINPTAISQFQSTPPARGATKVFKNSGSMLLLFQSTPPARGATASATGGTLGLAISIHAPREGGDV